MGHRVLEDTYIFKNWLKKDTETQVHIYCDIYHDYNYKIQELIEKKDEVYDSYIQELEKLRNYTKSCIEKLFGVEKASDTIQTMYIEKRHIYVSSGTHPMTYICTI